MHNIPQVELGSLRKMDRKELRLLWVNDWYDGPLEAVVEVDGELALLVLYGQDPTASQYRWLVLRLTAEQREDEERWHQLFAQHVGDHWCFHGDRFSHPPPASPRDPEAFYGPYRERPPTDLSGNAVIGWLDEMPAG